MFLFKSSPEMPRKPGEMAPVLPVVTHRYKLGKLQAAACTRPGDWAICVLSALFYIIHQNKSCISFGSNIDNIATFK